MPPTTRLPRAVSSALRVAVIPVILAWVACRSEDGPRLDGRVTVSVRYEKMWNFPGELGPPDQFRLSFASEDGSPVPPDSTYPCSGVPEFDADAAHERVAWRCPGRTWVVAYRDGEEIYPNCPNTTEVPVDWASTPTLSEARVALAGCGNGDRMIAAAAGRGDDAALADLLIELRGVELHFSGPRERGHDAWEAAFTGLPEVLQERVRGALGAALAETRPGAATLWHAMVASAWAAASLEQREARIAELVGEEPWLATPTMIQQQGPPWTLAVSAGARDLAHRGAPRAGELACAVASFPFRSSYFTEVQEHASLVIAAIGYPCPALTDRLPACSGSFLCGSAPRHVCTPDDLGPPARAALERDPVAAARAWKLDYDGPVRLAAAAAGVGIPERVRGATGRLTYALDQGSVGCDVATLAKGDACTCGISERALDAHLCTLDSPESAPPGVQVIEPLATGCRIEVDDRSRRIRVTRW